MAEKNGLPFFVRLLKWLISLLFTIVLLVLLLYGFIYLVFKIDTFAVIKELKILNQEVNESSLVVNPYSESDLTSAKNKAELSSLVQEEITFTDKEFASFLNNEIQTSTTSLTFSLGSSTLNLSDYNVSVKQIQFTPNEKDTVLTNFNAILKMDLSKLKSDYFSSFPLSIVGNALPDSIYVSATCELKNQPNGNYEYSIEPLSLTINNLSSTETTDIFNTLNKFVNFGNTDEFCSAICSSFANVLIGNDTNEGIYYTLKNLSSIYHAQSYSFEKIDNNNCFVIKTTYSEPDYYITYKNVDNLVNNNYIGYKETDTKSIVLNPVSKNGYEFLGWFENDTKQVKEINPADKKDVTLYAHFEIITYTITYNLKGGVFNETPKETYTIETETFNLPKPTKSDDEFEGWLGTNLTEKTKDVKIEKGTFGNLKFTARYYNDEKTVSIYVDGSLLTTQTVEAYTSYSIDETFNLDDYYLYGYSIQEWYSDENCTTEFTTINSVTKDFSIYGKTEYIVEDINFYPYIEEFNNAVSSKIVEINDRSEFVSWINYINFYHIDSSNIKIKITYCSSSTSQNLIDECTSAFSDFKALSSSLLKINLTSSSSALNGYATLSFNGEEWENYEEIYASETLYAPENEKSNYILEQEAYANEMNYPKTRDESYIFRIEKVSRTISGIKNTEQLLYALEHGYKPICIENSNADKMYKKAKEILRDICDDNMTNIQKLQAIYEYLALNVSYDYYAAEYHQSHTNEGMNKYDSWAVEGVFNNHKAVCEGYAKALLLMAKIENIPTIVVSGDGHEWNKVYIDGAWYGIDATHADSKLNLNTTTSVEMFTYQQFLFTDSFKTEKGYTATNFTDDKYKATTTFNIYNQMEINGTTLFLSKDDSEEVNKNKFATILNNTASYLSKTSEYYTIEFVIEKDSGITLETLVNYYNKDAKRKITSLSNYIKSVTTNGDTCYTLLIKTNN